jgi:DNA-binding MarR family transcriptional regulator
VALTDAGFAAVDAAVTDHVALEQEILSALTPEQRRALDDALRVLLATLVARAG